MPALPPPARRSQVRSISHPGSAARPWRRWARAWPLLPAAALLGSLLCTPPEGPQAGLSNAAGRCAAELGARRGGFADVGGFRLVPSSERREARGVEADLRARRNTAAGPSSGEIITVHCRVDGRRVVLTSAAPERRWAVF